MERGSHFHNFKEQDSSNNLNEGQVNMTADITFNLMKPSEAGWILYNRSICAVLNPERFVLAAIYQKLR